VAEREVVAVALVASGDDGERWHGWLNGAGAHVTRCADAAAAGALRPRPSVVVLDRGSDPSASGSVDTSLAGEAVIVLQDGLHGSSQTGYRWLVLPRSVSRSVLVGAALAMAAGLRVDAHGFDGARGATGASGPSHGSRPGEDEQDWSPETPTPRERDVLELAALGLTNRAIAARLGLSEHTVKFHLASVYGKLGARGRTQAVRRALRRGWIAI
jgi:DNA-binding NarL/FixJ family response regulator